VHREGVALVFDESVMDLPDYDCIDFFPNVPALPFNNMRAVLVNSDTDRERATTIIRMNNLHAEVTTRNEWENAKYSTIASG